MGNATEKFKILFVCLGNICRSPAAEGIMLKKVKNKGLSERFYIKSAGFYDHHEGELPDHRMRNAGRKRGYEFDSRSRPVESVDFVSFDLVVCMESGIVNKLLKKFRPEPDKISKIILMTEYCKKMNVTGVPDPYYEDDHGFEYVMDILEDACDGLLDKCIEKIS